MEDKKAFLGLSPMVSPNMGMWVNAARAARDGLMRYTRVQPGDGTILDALDPFVESQIDDSVRAMSKRVTAAMKGAEETSSTSSKSSRATSKFLTDEILRNFGSMEESARTPDPGALCLASVIRTIFNCVQIELAEAEAEAEAAAAAFAELKVKESKHPELKETESKFEKWKEDSQSNKEFIQPSMEERSSVNITILEEVIDDIAKEIENEVTDENN